MTVTLSRTAASLSAELETRRAAAAKQINAMSNDVRRKYITDIAGQEMIYREKESEARAFLAMNPYPTDLTNYPFIEGEMLATGDSAETVAQTFMNRANAWRAVGRDLEHLRIGAMTQIKQATTQAALDQIIDDFESSVEMF